MAGRVTQDRILVWVEPEDPPVRVSQDKIQVYIVRDFSPVRVTQFRILVWKDHPFNSILVGQTIHIDGLDQISEAFQQIHLEGFSFTQTAGVQVHIEGQVPGPSSAGSQVLHIMGITTLLPGQERLVYTITAVQGPVTGSWARLFGRLFVQVSSILRENISEQETLLVIQQVSEQWNWSENVTPTVFQCPLPSTTLFPSTTLYPC